MDGTGEHYVKWNKPDGEGRIPYDLTFNWNIINRKKKETHIYNFNVCWIVVEYNKLNILELYNSLIFSRRMHQRLCYNENKDYVPYY